MHIDENTLTRAASLVQEHTGLRSPESNHSHLRRVLVRLCRNRGISPESIIAHLRKNRECLQKFLNEAMIGETYFFREVSHFHVLLNHLLKELCSGTGDINLWSASCSTGEEAVSLAASAFECLADPAGISIKIYASDINTESIERLRFGTYPKSSLRNDGKELHSLLNSYIYEENGRTITLDKNILSSISVVPLNLYTDPITEIPDNLDIIFFRNTLIYAPADNRSLLVEKIARKLKPGGYLFVASSEVPFVDLPILESIVREDVYFFRRIDTGFEEKRKKGKKATTLAAKEPPITEGQDKKLIKCVQETVNAINMENQIKAERQLEEIENSYGNTVYTPYLRGLYFKYFGPKKRAQEELLKALSRQNDFWPASYYLAELYTETNPHYAYKEFTRCLEKMSSPQNSFSGSDLETILLDGFDKSCFRHLCSRWIHKLSTTEGEEYAH
ncbi:MAG: CheR family methyltransferase [Spirochaetaceae bacterium]